MRKGREPLSTASQSGKANVGRAASPARIWRKKPSIAGATPYLTPFRRRAARGHIRLNKSGKEFAITPHPAHQRADLFEIPGMDVFLKSYTFYVFGCTAAGEIEWPRKLESVAPRRAFEGGSVSLCLLCRSKRVRTVLTLPVGSGSNTTISSR